MEWEHSLVSGRVGGEEAAVCFLVMCRCHRIPLVIAVWRFRRRQGGSTSLDSVMPVCVDCCLSARCSVPKCWS
ncbi:hypothetical protein B0T14DRAFT_205570 [Immersiella caudata]|uniref:Uncharacterized protein n=1 Tax=Immersiella caudata TaxID=314043 RepID=A0AA40BZB4_9PEZI|nr:hypothetical protein B0T14DRAFT_205570 [Immersiella caudata]